MEESGSSGGGGSAVSRESLVSEGVPSASTAVAARFGDYAKVFGDLEGSCSIPFLDLPSAFDGLDDAPPGTLAYSEVFGASYGELFAEPEEASSSDPRARKTTEESTSSHQTMLDFKIFSPSQFHGNHMTMAYEEGDSSSSNSIVDNLSTQPNVSYSKAGQGIREGISSERIHVTQLHTASTSSLVTGGTADGSHTTSNDRMRNVKRQQKSPTSSSTTSKTSENYSKADQKHSISKHSVVENNSATASYSSCSSSSFTLSGDLSSSDTTDMTVSSVGLRRQPTQVPLTFEEVNVMSGAEASDALVKAMEFAQARLKIAKSSLEKRHQNLQKNKKLGQ
ncbi:uncharacterized protein LOC141831382 [Curcuma longa]|uniref:uncharacterized protein LOC141831382 n=1 Tax=Curcuma longa TaxID=136217 RepID=UPI003D9E844F